MPDLRIDEEQAERAVHALRELGAESWTAQPDAAAFATGHGALIAAAAQVRAAQERAVAAISAEAFSLADTIRSSVAEILGVDQDLATSSAGTSGGSVGGGA